MKRKIIAAVLCLVMTALSGTCSMAASDTNTAGNTATSKAAAFSDVSEDAWYAAAVKYVNDKGLFSGTAADTFSPSINMSRGMFVTVLGRAADISVDAVQVQTGFSDVDSSKYYAPYIKWASENGIVTGTSDKTFSPDADVSREQMCSIIVRYLREYKKLDLSSYSGSSAIFSDASAISSWASENVIAAQRMGIIEGKVSGEKLYFDPTGKTTRAAAAAVFQRLDAFVKAIESGNTPDPVIPVTPTQPDSTSGGSGGGGTGGNTGTDDSKKDDDKKDDTGKHTDEEIKEEQEVAGYLQNISAKYETTAYKERVSKPVLESMDLLVNTINKILADRNNGAFISSDYVKSTYGTEVEEFRTRYNALNETQNTEMQNLAIRLETEAHIYVVMDYFGVKQADI